MFVSCIVLAAGKGARFRSRIPKPLLEVERRPIIIRCLGILSLNPSIKEIIVVANPSNRDGIKDRIHRYHIDKVKGVVLGGRERKDSVVCGLKAISADAEFVLIHDAARPFIDKRLVASVIREAQKTKAAILAVPVKNTIKAICHLPFAREKIVARTLNRDELWEVQTPQVFERKLILEAYKRFGHCQVTDDAMLVEKLGTRVSVVEGSYDNIKITTPEDLVIAQAIAKLSLRGARRRRTTKQSKM
ncbi:MAG: 2-C-methyl-D-erythritol 4-phosphate cytidylyltransferase [Candidatus Omnitrophica bacterium]|nr:2-C-methyl-D-erythritol 4-phosphate cytidylyltransferase [Candidatus Omnitrophota bacterium]